MRKGGVGPLIWPSPPQGLSASVLFRQFRTVYLPPERGADEVPIKT